MCMGLACRSLIRCKCASSIWSGMVMPSKFHSPIPRNHRLVQTASRNLLAVSMATHWTMMPTSSLRCLIILLWIQKSFTIRIRLCCLELTPKPSAILSTKESANTKQFLKKSMDLKWWHWGALSRRKGAYTHTHGSIWVQLDNFVLMVAGMHLLNVLPIICVSFLNIDMQMVSIVVFRTNEVPSLPLENMYSIFWYWHCGDDECNIPQMKMFEAKWNSLCDEDSGYSGFLVWWRFWIQWLYLQDRSAPREHMSHTEAMPVTRAASNT